MENNEFNNEAESLFATKRKKQQEAEAEKKRLEELERQKQEMEAEVKRLEELKAAQLAQEAQWAQETQRAQEAQRAREVQLAQQQAQLAQQQAQFAQQQAQQRAQLAQQQAQQTQQQAQQQTQQQAQQQTQKAQQQTQQQAQPFGAAPGAKPAGAKKGLDPKTKKIVLYVLAAVGVVMAVLFAVGLFSGSDEEPGSGSEPESENTQVKTDTSEDGIDLLYFDGHQYLYVNLDMSWTEARTACIRMGGHLVTITSPEEQDFLMRNFYDEKLWIGAYCDEWGDWRWVTGEEWFYEYWADGEPNNSDGEEWCACFWTDMQWNDIREADPGDRVSGFICEFDDWTDTSAYEFGNG